MMQWKKDPNMKYVDLCIFIDENVHRLIEPDCPEELQDTIYNYLWLLVKALAIKKRMFTSFSDYDGYAFYSANRLYLALKKNLENQGKVIKGKEIRPIKSCLNYTKALLYPMKIEYLRAEYNLGLSEAQTSKTFDEFVYKQKLRDDVWQQQGGEDEFKMSVQDLFKHFNLTLTKVLQKAPFPENSPDYKKLKISILLNILSNLKKGNGLTSEPITIILWKLPKSMSSYIKLFLRELDTEFKVEIMSSYRESVIDDRILEYMLTNPSGEFKDYEE